MHPNGVDDILFRGLPNGQNRRSTRFFSSLCIHLGGIALVLLTVPEIVLRTEPPRFDTTLIAPAVANDLPKPEPEPPKPEPPKRVVKIEKPPPPAPVLRPLRRLVEPRVVTPKLEDAPVLPSPRVAAILPPPPPASIRSPIQTGVFGSSAPPEISPKLPVPPAQQAGFDTRSTDPRPAPAPAVIQTGAFAQAAPQQTTRVVAANVNHTAFDVLHEAEPAAVPDQIRKTGFDQPKAAAVASAKPAPPPSAAIRPLRILDKPKPAYTAEARTQKIEGTVLLDVIFAANGEVRVLGVVKGLGYGLDENAIEAARHIRFTPAVQSGAPVDQHVTLHVVFQITG